LCLPFLTRQSAGNFAGDPLSIGPLPHFCFFIWPKIANGKTRRVGPRNGAAHPKRWRGSAKVSALLVVEGRARRSRWPWRA
jgi:hypothetical protein